MAVSNDYLTMTKYTTNRTDTKPNCAVQVETYKIRSKIS